MASSAPTFQGLPPTQVLTSSLPVPAVPALVAKPALGPRKVSLPTGWTWLEITRHALYFILFVPPIGYCIAQGIQIFLGSFSIFARHLPGKDPSSLCAMIIAAAVILTQVLVALIVLHYLFQLSSPPFPYLPNIIAVSFFSILWFLFAVFMVTRLGSDAFAAMSEAHGIVAPGSRVWLMQAGLAFLIYFLLRDDAGQASGVTISLPAGRTSLEVIRCVLYFVSLIPTIGYSFTIAIPTFKDSCWVFFPSASPGCGVLTTSGILLTVALIALITLHSLRLCLHLPFTYLPDLIAFSVLSALWFVLAVVTVGRLDPYTIKSHFNVRFIVAMSFLSGLTHVGLVVVIVFQMRAKKYFEQALSLPLSTSQPWLPYK